MSDPQQFEAVLHSPLGEVRVTLDDQGAVRTRLRIDYDDEAGRLAHDQAALRLAHALAGVVRNLAGVGVAEAAAAGAAPSIGPWLVERCDPDPTSRTLGRLLYQDYLAWCDRRDIRPVALFDFHRDLDQRGFRTAGNIRQGGVQGRARGGLRLRLTGVPAAPAGPTAVMGEAGR